MNKELYDEAVRSNILSKNLISELMESMNYESISFINWTVDVLNIIKTRLERGDKITDEVSKITYDMKSFRKFVETNFSSYITSQVFDAPDKAEKVYFSLWKKPSMVIPTTWSWQVRQRTKHINGFPVSANVSH